MAFHYEPNHVSIRIRCIIIERYYKGDNIRQMVKDYAIARGTIEKYIRRYKKTNTILTDCEVKKKNSDYIKPSKGILMDNEIVKRFILDECIKHPTKTIWS